jgi:enolase
MKTEIATLRAHRIWDSRGRPTIEVEVLLADGTAGRGIAPVVVPATRASCALQSRSAGSVSNVR